jgi:hypothetical protein
LVFINTIRVLASPRTFTPQCYFSCVDALFEKAFLLLERRGAKVETTTFDANQL